MNVVAPALLIAYAVVAGVWGHRLLGRWRSLDRSPVAAILVWQTLSVSALASIILAGAAVAIPTIPATTDLADLFRSCAVALRDHYATPGGAVTSIAGAAAATVVMSRAVWALGWQLWVSHRQRCRQRTAARLVGQSDGVSGSLVIESPEPAVYCVPGRRRIVVLTSAALSRLDATQTAAVLAHEDVHLRYRHHLVLSIAKGLQRAFPFVKLYSASSLELARLVEIHADDATVKRHDRCALAVALVNLAEARSPLGGLGAGGTSTGQRVQRLVHPPRPMGAVRSLWLAVALAGMAVAPVILVAMPAISSLAAHYCPVHWSA